MTHFANEAEAVTYIFRSMRKLRGTERPSDDIGRDTRPTQALIKELNLLATPRDYTVVTGSKGKGSVTSITAKLVQALGHRVGMMSSPHLASWRERIRVDGVAIPEADFVRLLSELSPAIDAIEDTLTEEQYFSPQGIFLAVALRWFDEQGVEAAVLEVGRGGRFDDIAVVPNKLSLFSPISLEHDHYLGPGLARIAWHKAGIIKPHTQAYSLPQPPEVMQVLAAEAESRGAAFDWVAPMDMAQYIGPSEDRNGMRVRLGRYGEFTLSLMGRYQLANATLASIAAGSIHGRLGGVPHASQDYIERIHAGMGALVWPGRCQKVQDSPQVFLDGAIHAESALSLAESLRDFVTEPVVSIIAVPEDKDYAGVYAALAPISQAFVLTETPRNLILHFAPQEAVVALAREHLEDVQFAPDFVAALALAEEKAGPNGTIIIAGTQSIIADAVDHWGFTYESL